MLAQMRVLRTPDERFSDLPGYPFAPRDVETRDEAGTVLRIGYVDEGPEKAPPVLLLHGEPSWSYLYRHMIPVIAGAGLRAVAPDMVGFGRSDKPTEIADHTYARHVDWMGRFVAELDLRDVTLVAQDWGGLIGLRLVVEQTERFARVVTANTFLPTGDQDMPEIWHAFRQVVGVAETLSVSRIVQTGTTTDLDTDVLAAYDAPFPDESYKAGPRAMPELVPYRPDNPASEPNRRAWERLRALELPFLTAFADQDPITAGADRILQREIPGAHGQPHTTIRGAGHFLQEDRGEEFAQVVVDFVAATSG
jgi:haloalkane dehalogenase